MSYQSPPVHILFFPLMAPGHMLPMLDIAKLFSVHGVTSTLLTTPANALLLQPSIDHFNEKPNHQKINLHLIPFPSGPAVGLPTGCENLASVPSQDEEPKFLDALLLLRQPFDLVLRDLRPNCVVADGFLPWTYYIASELNIPWLVFHGTNLFARCAFDSIDRFMPYVAEGESFVLPSLPHRVEMLKSQMPDVRKLDKCFLNLFVEMKETEAKSYGVVVNSFNELEPEYVQHYTEVVGRRAWCVGPASLCNKDVKDLLGRGGGSSKSSIESENCLKWLDSRSPGSVLYVCFGSLCVFSKVQLREIALALEKCGHPFIWVIGKEQGEWDPEGYMDKIDGKGLILRGWVPQIAILNHAGVGGFLTHCGWNSSLEGISAGLPLVTWPLFAEQFYNERFIVDVLKIGVSVGAKVYSVKQEERPMIEEGEIEKAICLLMDDGEEAEDRRRRARELGEMAKRTVEEGGSSYENMSSLVRDLRKKREEYD